MLVNELTTIGKIVSNSEHLDLSLDGLPNEYESYISLVTSRYDLFTVDEVETLLLAREVRIGRSRKRALGSINLTKGLGSFNLNSGSSSLDNSVHPQSMNTNSQVQVNLTTQTSSEDNSANDYNGN